MRIAAASRDAATYGGVVQWLRADGYRGHRVRVSAYFRALGAERGAALWVRVDGARSRFAFRRVATDGSTAAPTPWLAASVVVPVTGDADGITVGGFLVGPGTLWLDDFDVRIADDSAVSARERFIAPLTGDTLAARYANAPGAPVNVGFER